MFIWFFFRFYVPLLNFSLIWRRRHYERKAANFNLYSALMVIEQLACHIYSDMGHPFIIVIFKDPWHSHTLIVFLEGKYFKSNLDVYIIIILISIKHMSLRVSKRLWHLLTFPLYFWPVFFCIIFKKIHQIKDLITMNIACKYT